MWVEITEGREKLIMGVIYRPPSLGKEAAQPIWQEMSRAAKYNNLCIMGDFNFRNIDWDNIVGDYESEDFLDAVQDNFLNQLITEPTRGDNILDLV